MEAEKYEQDTQGESEKSPEGNKSNVTLPKRKDGEGYATPSHEEAYHPQHLPWWRDSQWWQVIVAGILVPFGIYAVIVYSEQLDEMRKSTDAATRAAKAAEDSVMLTRETAHLDQQAWVAVTAISGTPKPDELTNINVLIRNSGKTFAKNVEGSTNCGNSCE